jgi:acyl carrier protein|tara:strand:- start:962 stop:1231 length:270 start_codon:yes stop_codon:yes gene_type:complete
MSTTNKEIEKDLIRYLKKGNPILSNMKNISMDESLVELGYIDSFGIIDLVTYFENKWKIKIENEEITKEQFGSINKMVNLISTKLLLIK